MNNFDKNYLEIQFRLKIHEKSATEFQSFFERIMQEVFPDFQKIRLYGNQGDGGNDGYRPEEGIYYQVYAPKDPNEKEAEAARKLKRDFEKLKKNWNQISEIKTFYFVFNDKDLGVTIELEKALAELRTANPEIEFDLFLPRKLEEMFFTLKKENISSLGFDIDSRNALRICKETLGKLEVYLDRGNGSFVMESLQNCKDIINSQNDEGLLADWEMLECRALQQLERINEAIEKYENLCKRYPRDPRPFLYLAEICLNVEDYDKNDELLGKAEEIDNSHWLLQLEKVLRDQRSGTISGASINENDFPSDPRVKSNYYRFYSMVFRLEKDFTKAESFIEKAIYLNPDRVANYVVKLGLLEDQISSNNEVKTNSEKLLVEVDSVMNKISQWGKISPRNQGIFNLEKFIAFQAQENYRESEGLAKEILELILQCYFDTSIDHFLTILLTYVQLPQKDFDRLLVYLREAKKRISDDLAKALIFQFDLKKQLFSEGKKLFEDKKKDNILTFIGDLENKNYDKVWNFIKDDSHFALVMANSAKDFPDLRRKIIQNLPDDGNIQKDKLLLLLNYDESNIDEAFDILKGLDLSGSRYFECKIILKIARKKKAWDFAIIVLEKLLEYEKDKNDILQIKIELFNANLSLERLPEAIGIGKKILADGEELALLDDHNKESLLAQTIIAELTRGNYPQAKILLEMCPDISKTFEFKAGVEAEVYLKNGDATKAVASIVAGIKTLKIPTPEQYAKLFIMLGEIDHMIDFSLTSLPVFEAESFVKFKDQERWYFVGDGEALDANKIRSSDERYPKFLDKKKGDKVVFDFKYRPSAEYLIESILPIEKYIFSQTVRHFNQLAADGNLEAVQMVQVPMKGDTIDTENIIALLEDQRKGRDKFFDFYCNNVIPLAFLAISEGGLTGAIAQIQNENEGFVRFSSGEPAEMKQQKEVAKRIIAGDPFYLDGTSALIVSETGLLAEIYHHLRNLRVPQSVITMLFKFTEKVKYIPGQDGRLRYSQGELHFSSIKPDESEALEKRLKDAITILEAKPDNIGAISLASKVDCASERKVPAELCDACILAQKEGIPVLTEDYLYLQADAMETGKQAPEYCSVFALMAVLYEQKKITFEKYLAFFAYLSGYRFRFLPFTSDDMHKAVFGDGIITMIQPDKLKWFNFSLTLSEEYGVTFATSFQVMGSFLMQVLTDGAILPDVAERVFLEILSGFPTDKDKRLLGKLFLKVCTQEIEKMERTVIIGTLTQRKIERLSQLATIYTSGNRLWMPSN